MMFGCCQLLQTLGSREQWIGRSRALSWTNLWAASSPTSPPPSKSTARVAEAIQWLATRPALCTAGSIIRILTADNKTYHLAAKKWFSPPHETLMSTNHLHFLKPFSLTNQTPKEWHTPHPPPPRPPPTFCFVLVNLVVPCLLGLFGFPRLITSWNDWSPDKSHAKGQPEVCKMRHLWLGWLL